jgi:GT2 family glycosyltransferase
MDDSERIDDAGDELSWYGVALKRGHNRLAAEYQESSEIFSPCAAACLYRRDFLLAVGGFDARFFAYLEDVDLGFRGRLLGYRYLYLPKAKVLHKGHGAEMPHSSYVAMVTRNRLLLFAKNVPARLLLRHAVRILYGQIYFLLAYARPWASIKGYLSFMAELPRAMTDRRRILKTTRMKPEDIDLLLHRRPPHTGLATLVGGYLSRLAGPATQ